MATSFGQWLKQQRTAAGLSQEELGARAACAGETIRKFEADARRPSRPVLDLLAAVFQIPPDEREAFIAFARLAPGPAKAGAFSHSPSSTGDGVAHDLAPWRALRARHTNLPVPPTELIGREREVAALEERLLGGKARLLTLSGPPGVGKTRLALAVAGTANVSAHFPDGVFFVPLAPLSDPALVPATIANLLGLKERGATPLLEILQQYLAARRLLLVLDNLEHLPAAAGSIADLLAACPWLHVVTTSRAPLQVRGERLIPVAPLAVPDLAALPPLAKLPSYAAVRLFVERAQDSDADFELGAANAAAVAGICVRLDGLPLAVELAAGRIRQLTAQAIAARLDQRMAVLVEGWRDLPPRQQTLRKAIAWSYDLLDRRAQVLFRRLGVFVGGCTAEAAAAVCAGRAELAGFVPQGLSALVAQHLLEPVANRDGEARVGMLETIREYAGEELEASGEAAEAHNAHARYFTSLAEAAETGMAGAEQRSWFERLRHEENNLRAALGWTLDTGALELALRLAGALGRFWYRRSSFAEGRMWLERVLDQDEAPASPAPIWARPKALWWHGFIAQNQADFMTAAQSLHQAERLARRHTEDETMRWVLAGVLQQTGAVARLRGDYGEAKARLDESIELYRDLANETGLGWSLFQRSVLAHDEADMTRQATLLEEAEQHFRAAGAYEDLVYIREGQSTLALVSGDLDRGERLTEEFTALYEQWDDKRGVAMGYYRRGDIAYRRGDYGAARGWHGQSLRLRREIGDPQEIWFNWLSLAWVAQGEGHAGRAARLLGACAAIRASLALAVSPLQREDTARLVAAVREVLDEAAFEAAWAEGAAMTVEQVIAYALEEGAGE